jgi:esterase/lipase superfamily enzyme
MNREYHKWYSNRLGRDMEMLLFGHAGVPVLVFPTSQGRFFEYEDRGMVGTLADRLEHGKLMLFCVDSVDSESWYNKRIHPADRVKRHLAYESYILEEVVPLIRERNDVPRLAAHGCSFGAYHSLNISLRRPDVFTDCLTMSGAFDIKQFLDGYYDTNCYFNNPPDYLPALSDPWHFSKFRQNNFLFVTGEHDMCWNANEEMAHIFRMKGIPHNLFVWGDGTGHDWPWWQKMAAAYFPR